MLRIFTLVKIQRLRPGLNPQTWVPEASMLSTRPPKPSKACYIKSKANHVSLNKHGHWHQSHRARTQPLSSLDCQRLLSAASRYLI